MSYRRRRKKKKGKKIGFLRLSAVKTNRHHRCPKSRGGTWATDNISVIPIRKHAAWHCLFENYDVYAIVHIINKVFLDPAYRLEVKEVCVL